MKTLSKIESVFYLGLFKSVFMHFSKKSKSRCNNFPKLVVLLTEVNQ